MLRHLRFSAVKWYLGFEVEFERSAADGMTASTTARFTTTPNILLNSSEIDRQYDEATVQLLRYLDTYQALGSGWALSEITRLEVAVGTYDPIGGSSYLPTPLHILNKRATVNIKN